MILSWDHIGSELETIELLLMWKIRRLWFWPWVTGERFINKDVKIGQDNDKGEDIMGT